MRHRCWVIYGVFLFQHVSSVPWMCNVTIGWFVVGGLVHSLIKYFEDPSVIAIQESVVPVLYPASTSNSVDNTYFFFMVNLGVHWIFLLFFNYFINSHPPFLRHNLSSLKLCSPPDSWVLCAELCTYLSVLNFDIKTPTNTNIPNSVFSLIVYSSYRTCGPCPKQFVWYDFLLPFLWSWSHSRTWAIIC